MVNIGIASGKIVYNAEMCHCYASLYLYYCEERRTFALENNKQQK